VKCCFSNLTIGSVAIIEKFLNYDFSLQLGNFEISSSTLILLAFLILLWNCAPDNGGRDVKRVGNLLRFYLTLM